MFDAIIVMAGEGKRTGLELNKVFYPLLGVELFIYSVKTFLNFSELNQLILVTNPNEQTLIKQILTKHHLGISDKIVLTSGGQTRAESVRNGLQLTSADKIVMHDAARPLVRVKDIDQLLRALEGWDAVTLVNPIYDTVKVVEDHLVTTTLNRETLKKVLTPQGIKSHLKDKILHPHLPDYQITDEMVLLEKECKVFALETTTPGIKMTTMDDVPLLEYYLQKRKDA